MRIGATLADARWRAHLTVDEVSSRTRIREAIIWGIEQDDFSICGGDAYARGHIRAIAQAIGIDADPLIRQYDETYRTHEDIETVVAPPPPPPSPGHDPQPTQRRRLGVAAVLAVVVLAIVGWAAYHLASGVGHTTRGQAVAAAGQASASQSGGAAAGRGSPQPSPTPSTPSPAPTPSASPAPVPAHAAAPPSRALGLTGAVPFGPGGEGTGDNPQSAAAAIDSSTATAWHSDWYTSASLGNLKPGTGLLVGLGRRVTVTDAQLDLGGFYGATIQLRAGVTPSGLREVASAENTGGTVRLVFSAPTRARYVLIWFTRLPPDGSGTYQASVYHVIIRGHS